MTYKDFNDREILYLISENNEEAFNFMYYKYEPLIKKNAKLFYKYYQSLGVEYDDLYQEGMYGLNNAINNYNNEDNNALFYTLALLCIRREMQKCVVKQSRNKNIFYNSCYSINNYISENSTLEDVLYNISDITDYKYDTLVKEKDFLDTKYNLDFEKSIIFELKTNGFSNVEISKLLDLPYKKVDNSMRGIKKNIKENYLEY